MAGSAVARGLRGYGALLSVPGVRPVILWGLLARVPFGMSVLAMVFMVRATGGAYADAGIVTRANTRAGAPGAPLPRRAVDPRPPETPLLPHRPLLPAPPGRPAGAGPRGAPPPG